MIITVIDTETTGLDLLQHEVIEIGMIKMHVEDVLDGAVKCVFNAKLKPLHIERASPVALKVNGYTEDKWISAINPASAFPVIKSWVEESDFVLGQNLFFDYGFINKLFDDYNEARPKWPDYIDTKYLADKLVHDGKLKRSSLDFLCEHFNIPNNGRAHTALVDAQRTWEVFKVLKKQVEVEKLSFKKPFDPYSGQKNDTK